MQQLISNRRYCSSPAGSDQVNRGIQYGHGVEAHGNPLQHKVDFDSIAEIQRCGHRALRNKADAMHLDYVRAADLESLHEVASFSYAGLRDDTGCNIPDGDRCIERHVIIGPNGTSNCRGAYSLRSKLGGKEYQRSECERCVPATVTVHGEIGRRG